MEEDGLEPTETPCLCLESAGNKDMHHYTQLSSIVLFFNEVVV